MGHFCSYVLLALLIVSMCRCVLAAGLYTASRETITITVTTSTTLSPGGTPTASTSEEVQTWVHFTYALRRGSPKKPPLMSITSSRVVQDDPMPTLVYNCAQLPHICNNVKTHTKYGKMNPRVLHYDPEPGVSNPEARDKIRANIACPQGWAQGTLKKQYRSTHIPNKDKPDLYQKNKLPNCPDAFAENWAKTQYDLDGTWYSCDEFPARTTVEGGPDAQAVCAPQNWGVLFSDQKPLVQAQIKKLYGDKKRGEQDKQSNLHRALGRLPWAKGATTNYQKDGFIHPFVLSLTTDTATNTWGQIIYAHWDTVTIIETPTIGTSSTDLTTVTTTATGGTITQDIAEKTKRQLPEETLLVRPVLPIDPRRAPSFNWNGTRNDAGPFGTGLPAVPGLGPTGWLSTGSVGPSSTTPVPSASSNLISSGLVSSELVSDSLSESSLPSASASFESAPSVSSFPPTSASEAPVESSEPIPSESITAPSGPHTTAPDSDRDVSTTVRPSDEKDSLSSTQTDSSEIASDLITLFYSTSTIELSESTYSAFTTNLPDDDDPKPIILPVWPVPRGSHGCFFLFCGIFKIPLPPFPAIMPPRIPPPFPELPPVDIGLDGLPTPLGKPGPGETEPTTSEPTTSTPTSESSSAESSSEEPPSTVTATYKVVEKMTILTEGIGEDDIEADLDEVAAEEAQEAVDLIDIGEEDDFDLEPTTFETVVVSSTGGVVVSLGNSSPSATDERSSSPKPSTVSMSETSRPRGGGQAPPTPTPRPHDGAQPPPEDTSAGNSSWHLSDDDFFCDGESSVYSMTQKALSEAATAFCNSATKLTLDDGAPEKQKFHIKTTVYKENGNEVDGCFFGILRSERNSDKYWEPEKCVAVVLAIADKCDFRGGHWELAERREKTDNPLFPYDPDLSMAPFQDKGADLNAPCPREGILF